MLADPVAVALQTLPGHRALRLMSGSACRLRQFSQGLARDARQSAERANPPSAPTLRQRDNLADRDGRGQGRQPPSEMLRSRQAF
eukprot:5461735-Pyramimonas_sp.AAC.1